MAIADDALGDGQFNHRSIQEHKQQILASLYRESTLTNANGGANDQSIKGDGSDPSSGAGGVGAGGLRFDLLADDLINKLCARNDEELIRLRKEVASFSVDDGTHELITEETLPAWFIKLQATPDEEEELVVSGKRKRSQLFGDLSDKGMISTLQCMVADAEKVSLRDAMLKYRIVFRK